MPVRARSSAIGKGLSVLAVISVALSGPARGAELTAVELELFEGRIRPVLIEHCYQCHNSSTRAENDLAVDSREALRTGGRRGPAVVPGKPGSSLLLRAMRHPSMDLRMPLGGAKLPDDVIGDFERWIELGAPDPRDEPPSAAELHQESSWPAVLEARKSWWSFRPIERYSAPDPASEDWKDSTIDRFLAAKFEEAGVKPAAPASPRVILRRLSYVLHGLPPTRLEVERFVNRAEEDLHGAIEEEVDRRLAAPEFGERWAQHWLDWFRYAETHGSEGDPQIPYAWRYRDYVIRALNADVPYDQLVREQIAGDLLQDPRVHRALELNESMIGASQYRLTLHGFGPTDALDEQVRFTENQIDVVSKAFLGLTVACARCHDHKFDAISQTDFYALYGVMASSRPGIRTVDTQERRRRHVDELAAIKSKIRREVAAVWRQDADRLARRLLRDERELADLAGRTPPHHPLTPWLRLSGHSGPGFGDAWSALRRSFEESQARVAARQSLRSPATWRLSDSAHAAQWFGEGTSSHEIRPPGDFTISRRPGELIGKVFPGGFYSDSLSTRHSGWVSSPRFAIGKDQRLVARMLGDGGAVARYVVQNYPQRGEVFPIKVLHGNEWFFQEWDLSYWEGDHAYFEVVTATSHPITGERAAEVRQRSSFGVSDVFVLEPGEPTPQDELAEFTAPLFTATDGPSNRAELAQRYAVALGEAVESFAEGRVSDEQARFLEGFRATGLLTNEVEGGSEIATLAQAYRKLEAELPEERKAPGQYSGTQFDQPLFDRGNHKAPKDEVPQRFLEAIDPRPFERLGDQPTRLELAERLLHPSNPLTARVIVNRIWHHVFGRGIVATPDNLGRMGEQPPHPELLDTLASSFREDGWSIKNLVRRLVLTRAFRSGGAPSASAREKDPDGKLFSHALVRRLDAEAIRDSMVALTGDLEQYLGTDVERRPTLGTSNARSVYVEVIRNQPDPILAGLDKPTPVTTKGRRDQTTVPAQSLLLMNDPQVMQWAERFARRALADEVDDSERVSGMFVDALGRPPTPEETRSALSFIAGSRSTESPARERQAIRDALDAKVQERKALAEEAEKGALAILNYRRRETAPVAAAIWYFQEAGDRKTADALGDVILELPKGATVGDGSLSLPTGREAISAPLDVGRSSWSAVLWLREGEDVRQVAATRLGTRAPVWYINGRAAAASAGADLVALDRKGRLRLTARSSALEILQLRLYERALTSEEIEVVRRSHLFNLDGEDVTRLRSETIKQLERHDLEIERLRASLGPPNPWRDLAHAIFHLKEFTYLQ